MVVCTSQDQTNGVARQNSSKPTKVTFEMPQVSVKIFQVEPHVDMALRVPLFYKLACVARGVAGARIGVEQN